MRRLRRAARSASSRSCAAGALGLGQRQRRGVGAHQHQRRAEFLHQVELALGPLERAPVLGLGQAFEVAERLVQVDREAEVRRAIARSSRALPAKCTKSFSNSSMPSKRAAAIASSFSRKVPLIETVATQRRMAQMSKKTVSSGPCSRMSKR
jgi:hypothetical protein